MATRKTEPADPANQPEEESMALDEKQQKQQDKVVATAVKSTQKNTQDQLKAEIDRVKASDLSKPEQKAAIAALKNVQAAVKSPIG